MGVIWSIGTQTLGPFDVDRYFVSKVGDECRAGMKLKVSVREDCYFQVRRGKLIQDAIETWGPAYRISFKIYIKSVGNGVWYEVIRFKLPDATVHTDEGRMPGIFLRHQKPNVHLHINPKMHEEINVPVSLRTWHTIEIVRKKTQDNRVMKHVYSKIKFKTYLVLLFNFQYYVKVWKDGEEFEESVPNDNTNEYQNVEVWAAAVDFPPTNAVIKDFHFTGREIFYFKNCCILYIVLRNIFFIQTLNLNIN